MLNDLNSFVLVLVIALITFLTRVLPFLIFHRQRETPKYISYLGKVLPYAIIGMLIIYCLRSVDLLAGSRGLPEGISILMVILLHLWKRNTLLSILGGTALYMLLIQFVFI